MDDRYMPLEELSRASKDMHDLISEVLKHQASLTPTTIRTYQPSGLMSRRSTWRRRDQPIVDMAGFAFGEGHPSNKGVIVETENFGVRIATMYGFPRRNRKLYALHTVEDYVCIWLADTDDKFSGAEMARRTIDSTRFQIERLLPDGHPMKRELDTRPLDPGGANLGREALGAPN